MNKKFSLCLFWLAIFLGSANSGYVFANDMTFSQLPADTLFCDNRGGNALDSWNNATDWISDGSLIKHNLEGVAGKSFLSAHTDGLFANGTTTWTFRLSSGFEPTTSNKFCYWLMASDADLSDSKISGYAVGVCQSASEKNLTMYRIDKGSKKILYQTRYQWTAEKAVEMVVTRTPKGSWTLSYIVGPETSTDTIAGDDFIDNTYSDLQYHGYHFVYSKTRAGQLWVGNTTIVRQKSPIALQSAVCVDEKTVEIQFSGAPDSLSAVNAANYTIDGAAVSSAQFNPAEPLKVTIKTSSLAAGTHTLAVSGIIGRNGLTMEPQQIDFEFIPPAEPFDLVFNEIMYNSTDGILPNYDYLELYNSSSRSISLGGWTLDISGTVRKLPDSTIAAGNYLIITTATAVDTFSVYGKAASGLTSTSLTNSGRTLRLVSPEGQIIDSLTYSDKVISDAEKSNGGWALERIDPQNTCGGWNNWAYSTDKRGGTPGQRNSVYAINRDKTPVRIVNLMPIADNQLRLEFSEIPTYNSMTSADNYRLGSLKPGAFSPENNKLTVIYSTQFKSDAQNEIKISKLTDECGNVMKDTTIQFTYHRAQLYDLVVSEIMATPEPSAGLPENEWIELYNRSSFDIYLVGYNIRIGNKYYTIDDGMVGAKNYAILTKNGGDNGMQKYGNVVNVSKMPALPQSGSITIFDDDNHPVCQTDYKQNWFADDLRAAGGFSLERIDVDNADESVANWAQTASTIGGTPCAQNSINQIIIDAVRPQLIRVVPTAEKTLQLFFSEPVTIDGHPEMIGIEPAGCAATYAQTSGTNLATAIVKLDNELSENETYTLTIDAGLKDIAGNTIGNNTATFALSQKAEKNDLIISEILFNPYPNSADFVELYNRSDHAINIAGLVLATRADGNLKTPKTIDGFGSILLPNSYIAISTDIANIAATYRHGELYQVASLPSMPDGEGNIVLADTAGNIFDEVNYSSKMHFGLLKDLNGVSLERIDNEQHADNPGNWHSASEQVGWATPGLPNSAARPISTDSESLISLNSEVFSPDNDGFEDQLEIAYNVDEAGYVANVTIFNAKGLKMRALVNNQLLGTSGFWAWDGLDDNNRRVPTGIYVIYCELFDLDGKVKKEKKVCVVATKM